MTSTEPPFLRGFLIRGGIVLCLNSLIALALIGTGWSNWHTQLFYAQAIGLSIWLICDLGRFALPRDSETGWPNGWWRVSLQVFGIFVGNIIGSKLGDMYSGHATLEALMQSPRRLLSYIMLSAVFGFGISFAFNSRHSTRRLNDLISKAKRDAAENQLKLLQSQLEPHMLFNTLANLRVLIAMDPPRAQLMLDHLIGFLRSTLTASRNMLHPLSTEFARLDDYLALMKIRMGNRLQTELLLPPDMGTLAVPTLLLQPLVENAISHGLEPNIDGGQLRIEARRDDNDLLLEVLDSGVGLDAPSTGGTHFGLEQVRQRLATLYGPQASLTLSAGPSGSGTLAAVRIPLSSTA
ncbi:MAG: hypothetical protein RLZZ618_4089 [Pseudomonadota bacterium]|jgi:LytS/YehU family sensor histidine kinase